MVNKLLFPWIIVIQTIVLLVTVGVAYSAENEAIESAVGPHLLHIVTISLLLITFITPTKEARSYARVYSWTNLAMDNIALLVMLFRYSQRSALKLGDEDLVHLVLYIVSVLILVVVDIHNITFTWDVKESPPSVEEDMDPVVSSDPAEFEAAAVVAPYTRMISIRPTLPRIVIQPLKLDRVATQQHPSLLKLV